MRFLQLTQFDSDRPAAVRTDAVLAVYQGEKSTVVVTAKECWHVKEAFDDVVGALWRESLNA